MIEGLPVNPFYKGIDIVGIKIDGSPNLKALQEKAFKEGVVNDVKRSIKAFTFKENMDIAFTPLIVFEVAWHYAMRVVDACARLRIDDTKKLCRAIRFVRESYLIMCKKDLDNEHIKRLERVKDDFIERCETDFLVLWFTISNDLKKNYPKMQYVDEVIVDATLCLIILDVLMEHNRKMDDVIKKRIGHVNPYRNPFVDALHEAMEAMVRPTRIEGEQHIRVSKAIMHKNLGLIQYDVV